jgi:hypothetical protein
MKAIGYILAFLLGLWVGICYEYWWWERQVSGGGGDEP